MFGLTQFFWGTTFGDSKFVFVLLFLFRENDEELGVGEVDDRVSGEETQGQF